MYSRGIFATGVLKTRFRRCNDLSVRLTSALENAYCSCYAPVQKDYISIPVPSDIPRSNSTKGALRHLHIEYGKQTCSTDFMADVNHHDRLPVFILSMKRDCSGWALIPYSLDKFV